MSLGELVIDEPPPAWPPAGSHYKEFEHKYLAQHASRCSLRQLLHNMV